ncbi:hypothetical protein ACLRAD_07735 [Gallibacterium anatis]|uniref:hypothetical protein n=1 Tax=Gallibacterium anatis TaxID=750 RepID=UPI0039FD5263
MYYNQLFNFDAINEIKISILGSNGGFGYSLLAQCGMIDKLNVSVVCDIDLNKTISILLSLGYPEKSLKVCHSVDEIEAAIERKCIAIINNPYLLPYSPVDMLIESTGNPELGAEIAKKAIINKQHIGMVSKETESVVGPYLAKLANDYGVTYTTIDGDQPSNLINLYSWISCLGLKIIAAGKSSEYDFIYYPENNIIKYLDLSVRVDDFSDIYELGDDVLKTLDDRRNKLISLPQYATPDYCEMNVVANSLGLSIDKEELHYPIIRINELADVFIPKKDGGILESDNVVEVFNCLRKNNEISFAGGEFVIVECHNREVWKILKEKGHIVSRNNKYAAIILPYHLMGVESPISIFSAVIHNRASGNPQQKRKLVMGGKAERDFYKDEVLSMGGHHHVIKDVRPLLFDIKSHEDVAPFYLMSNKKLTNDVKKGDVFKLSDFDFSTSELYKMYNMID